MDMEADAERRAHELVHGETRGAWYLAGAAPDWNELQRLIEREITNAVNADRAR